MQKKLVHNEKGQTTVEYIFLVAAMVAVMGSVLTTVRDRLLPSRNPCPTTDQTLGCNVQRIFTNIGATDPTLRYFNLRRSR